MVDGASLDEILQPLLRVMEGGRHLRLVARPGWVSVDRPEGLAQIEAPWPEESHAQVVDRVERAHHLPDRTVVTLFDGALVLRRPPDPFRRVDDIVRDGWISPLAGRLLSQSLELGRNILLCGPWAVCLQLGAALLAEGTRVAFTIVDDPHAATITDPGTQLPAFVRALLEQLAGG